LNSEIERTVRAISRIWKRQETTTAFHSKKERLKKEISKF
jgi:hypothetical protein